jgi:WD40 repeat protein
MKRVRSSMVLLLSVLMMSGNAYGQDALPIPDGPYLGQTPPGSTPEIFAPGIVNTEENREVEGMFAADMKEFYFIRRPVDEQQASNVLVVIEYKNNRWQESVAKQGVSTTSISPDGKTFYLKTQYMERTNAGWSEPKSLGTSIENIDIMRSSASSNGTLYFDTYTEKLDAPLRASRLIDGKYGQPKSLGPQFGIGKYNAHPFIAPDESYIIWDSRRESGYGTSDLYISFRAMDGTWGPAINMGDKINTTAAENYPSVSPDGKFIFFDRRNGERIHGQKKVDIYWVDAQIIETLRPKP